MTDEAPMGDIPSWPDDPTFDVHRLTSSTLRAQLGDGADRPC